MAVEACQARFLPKIFTASAQNCSMHVVGSPIAGFYDGIAQLVAGPHLGESLHGFIAQRCFRRVFFVVARIIVDVGETHGEQLQRQFEGLCKRLAEIKTVKNLKQTRRIIKNIKDLKSTQKIPKATEIRHSTSRTDFCEIFLTSKMR